MNIPDVAATIGQIKIAFDMFRSAIGLAKDVKESLPEGEKKRSITESLEAADRAAHIAEAQIAKSLGYQLCQCTFPPQIMLSIGYRGSVEYFRCPKCNKEYPPPEPAPRDTKAETDFDVFR